MTGLHFLPTAPEDGPEQHHQNFKGVPRILGPNWAQLPTITVGMLGVSILWSVEMSYASPYLLSLGLSKSSMAGVFVAGPLSGLIVQPLIGVLADNCTSRFGRRRPYMLLGTVICVFAMLLLGFTRPVASIFTALGSHSNDLVTIWLAVFAIYLIDFSINVVQAVDRALLVDTIPSAKQASGNAWAARMSGVGSLIGFFVGNINLPRSFPFLGKTQLQVLSVLSSLLLLAGHLLMAGLVKERVLVQDTSIYRKSFPQEVKDLWNNLFTLPKVIRQIFIIQFFSSIAWFPMLFYSTIYVGDLYKRSLPATATDEQQTIIDEEATRLGSRALFYSALLSLVVSLVLPVFVAEAAGHPSQNQRSSWWNRVCRVPRGMQVHLVTMWATSQLVFAGCMFATFFTNSVRGSTSIITVTGFSAAIGLWAPFSLLAEGILTEPITIDEIRLVDARTWPQEESERDVFLEHDSEDENKNGEVGLLEFSNDVIDDQNEDCEVISDEQESNGRANGVGRSDRILSSTLSSKAGIILGIHNIFIVIPQFLVTGLTAIIFALVDPQKPLSPDHNSNTTQGKVELNDSSHSDSVVYIFRICGVAALLAFVLCWRLAREIRHR